MRMIQRAQLDALLAPLPEEVGQPVEECEAYVRLDEELMKIGSLHHGEIDWASAEALAIDLLSETGKDLRVLGHLLHCWQQGGEAQPFALSLELLAGVLTRWWDRAYPRPGSAGQRFRERLFQQFIRRAVNLIERVDFQQAADTHEASLEALRTLRQAASDQRLTGHDLEELLALLVRATPASPGADETEVPAAATTSAEGEPTSQESRAPEPYFEAGNERGNRQALLKMADFINEQAPGEALGYRLRRYAIWHAILSLPATRDGRRTELAAVSVDLAAEYREAAMGQPALADWQRIEHSLALCPFWLEGHRLSAEMARRLAFPDCAAAIHDEAMRFVARLEGIEALTFSDGSPFVDSDTWQWLEEGAGGRDGGDSAGAGAVGAPWQAGLEAAREALDASGLATALAVLEEGLASAGSPREGVYWRLTCADLLREAGLPGLARQHYQTLYEAVSTLGLKNWEPALPARLASMLES
ncbi:type VI secretion system protein TssA [Halomonas sp. 328]|uniref:type VI secretion system protein TssA n=1 Tax=Halomonas sp. 328 TaxID=2776704 RepID=UPI0018A7AC4A|nr:type VI secretion system protein TssA [Halomonas sp. 328]MBF8224202.1 type VI secretion system protein TssA [Halomonas sp. 328]